VVIGVVAERLAQDDTVDKGFVLDGFPRTQAQAEELERLLAPAQLNAAIDIDVPTQVVLHRLSGRRVCRECGAIYHLDSPPRENWTCDECGGEVVQREDDTEEAICRRLELYEQETGPLIDFYDEKGLLVRVDGVGSVDEVFDRVMRSVEDGRRLGLSAR
jgi:adenylate kinase